MSKTYDTARVYVGTYAKYNAGSIKGAWIDLEDHDEDSFNEAIRELHSDEQDPEFMYQDREGLAVELFAEGRIREGAWEVLEAWKGMDGDRREAFGDFLDNGSHDLDSAVEGFEEAYQGHYDSAADFAEETAEELGEIPKDLPSWIHIDWEWSARELFMSDYWMSDNGHVFRNI